MCTLQTQMLGDRRKQAQDAQYEKSEMPTHFFESS